MLNKISTMARLRDSIKLYFRCGLRHGEMLNLLSTVDDINICMHTLRKILKCIENHILSLGEVAGT